MDNFSQTPPPCKDGHAQLLQKLDRIEAKLDKYSEKLYRAENDLEWVKAGLKIIGTFVVGIIGTIITFVIGKHQ